MKWEEEFLTLHNSLGTCILSNISVNDLTELYYLTTGIECSVDTLFKASERIINLQRLFNINKSGIKQNFDWPKPFYDEILFKKGHYPSRIDPAEVEKTLNKYCDLRHWDRIDFKPGKKIIKELELDKIIDKHIKI